jgi:hypothetical protein
MDLLDTKVKDEVTPLANEGTVPRILRILQTDGDEGSDLCFGLLTPPPPRKLPREPILREKCCICYILLPL